MRWSCNVGTMHNAADHSWSCNVIIWDAGVGHGWSCNGGVFNSLTAFDCWNV